MGPFLSQLLRLQRAREPRSKARPRPSADRLILPGARAEDFLCGGSL